MTGRAGSLLVVILLLGLLSSSAEGQRGGGRFGLGISGSGNMLRSDWEATDVGFGASAPVSYSLNNNWGVLSSLGFDTFSGETTSEGRGLSTFFYGKLAVSYTPLPTKLFSPSVFAGAGLAFYYPRIDNGRALLSGRDRPWDVFLNGGLELNYYLGKSWSIILTTEADLMGSDNIDGYAVGSNEILVRVCVGIRYYLFDRTTVQRIVNALKK